MANSNSKNNPIVITDSSGKRRTIQIVTMIGSNGELIEFTDGGINANITNTTLDVNANITNASLDVDITNETLDVNVTNATLNVDANITNASLDVSVTNNEVSILDSAKADITASNPFPVELNGVNEVIIKDVGGNKAVITATGQVQVTQSDVVNIQISDDQIDGTTNALKVVNYAHVELHSGTHYIVRKGILLAKNATRDILIVTPNTTKWAHLIIEIQSNDSAINFSLYEDTETSNNGILDGARNRNRNIADNNTTLVFDNPVVTGVGTLLYNMYLGSGKTSGGGVRDNEEILLKQNTKYLLRIIEPNIAATNINWVLDWYEHTNIA